MTAVVVISHCSHANVHEDILTVLGKLTEMNLFVLTQVEKPLCSDSCTSLEVQLQAFFFF